MFKKKVRKNIEPKERGIYAFTKHRRGDFILFLEKNGDEALDFMQLPDRYKITLTPEEFTEGVTTKVLDFVEQIPLEVFEVSKANVNNFEKKLDEPSKKNVE